MNTKIIYAAIIILILIGLGFLMYKLSFNNEPEKVEPDIVAKESQNTVYQLSEDQAIAPAINQRQVIYYSKSNGNVFEVDLDGSNHFTLSSAPINNLVKVLWSPDNSQVISLVNDNYLFRKYLYNYRTDQSVEIDWKIRWIDWSPSGDKIAYQYYDSGSQANSIAIADPDGANWHQIMDTRLLDLIVEWPSLNTIALREQPRATKQSAVYAIDLESNDFKKIIDYAYGLSALWSPDASKILFSETNSQGGNLKLKIADLGKATVSELTVTTLAEKCVWGKNNQSLVCAVPQNIPTTAVLPDDFYQNKIIFDDEFYIINLAEGQASPISRTDFSQIDAHNLLLSDLEDYLVFINKLDGLLYSLKLE